MGFLAHPVQLSPLGVRGGQRAPLWLGGESAGAAGPSQVAATLAEGSEHCTPHRRLGFPRACFHLPHQQCWDGCRTRSRTHRLLCAARCTVSGPFSKEGSRDTRGKGPARSRAVWGKDLALAAALLRPVQATQRAGKASQPEGAAPKTSGVQSGYPTACVPEEPVCPSLKENETSQHFRPWLLSADL